MSNYYILKKYFFPFVIIFFTELYTYSMECPVCCDTISKGKKITVLPCKHSFCKGCCYEYIVEKLEVILKKYIA